MLGEGTTGYYPRVGNVEEVTAVQYLLAAIGAATVTVLLWKAFGPQLPGRGGPAVAPDDDPEFLSGLTRRLQEPNEEG